MAIVPAVLVTIGRFFVPQSGAWLVSQGASPKPRKALCKLLDRQPPYPNHVALCDPDAHMTNVADRNPGFHKLFKKKHRRATVLASLPWFLQDLSTYGIGIFTPTILAVTLGTAAARRAISPNSSTPTCSPRRARRCGHPPARGHRGRHSACGQGRPHPAPDFRLYSAAPWVSHSRRSPRTSRDLCSLGYVFAGFMLFNLMTISARTRRPYLIAGEVFPTRMRGLGAGFAASFAKIGAVLTAFLFPILLKDLGTAMLLPCARRRVTDRRGDHMALRHRDEGNEPGKDELGISLEHLNKSVVKVVRRPALVGAFARQSKRSGDSLRVAQPEGQPQAGKARRLQDFLTRSNQTLRRVKSEYFAEPPADSRA